MCTTCAKKEVRRSRQQRSTWQGWDDDPYLYDTYYYHGYGYFRHGYWGHDFLGDDLTEADGDMGPEADGDWETDMGAS